MEVPVVTCNEITVRINKTYYKMYNTSIYDITAKTTQFTIEGYSSF